MTDNFSTGDFTAEDLRAVIEEDDKELEESKNYITPKKHLSRMGITSSAVRDVPTPVMKRILVEFPKARNQTDALMAYMACHSNDYVHEEIMRCLSPAQVELVNNWEGDDTNRLDKKMNNLIDKIDKLMVTGYHAKFFSMMAVYYRALSKLPTDSMEDFMSQYEADTEITAFFDKMTDMIEKYRRDEAIRKGRRLT